MISISFHHIVLTDPYWCQSTILWYTHGKEGLFGLGGVTGLIYSCGEFGAGVTIRNNNGVIKLCINSLIFP